MEKTKQNKNNTELIIIVIAALFVISLFGTNMMGFGSYGMM
jgi:hypothetical protein